jgi:hypothetical protein
MSDELPGERTETMIERDGLTVAREGLARTAKEAGAVIKELAFKALELEQAALFEEPEFEPAFFMEPEAVKKRYTAAQCEKFDMRRRTCVYLLARNCPIQDIQRLLEMNFRTVKAIAAQNGRALAGFTEAYADELQASAASDIALADTKKHEASYKDLHIGAGIKLTHATALKLTVSGVDPNDGVIDLEEENPTLQKARQFLKARQLERTEAGK